jgi:hypothetical protein
MSTPRLRRLDAPTTLSVQRSRRSRAQRRGSLQELRDGRAVAGAGGEHGEGTVSGDGTSPMNLADGVLTAAMKHHFATQEEAVAVVWPFLRAWELDRALACGRREAHFTFRAL